MKKVILTILLIFSGVGGVLAAPAVSREEYAIYALVLKSIRLENPAERKTKYSFVILDETFAPTIDDGEYAAKFVNLTKDFRRRNETPVRLAARLPVAFEYRIIGKSRIDELLETGARALQRIEEEAKRRNGGGGGGGDDIIWRPFYDAYRNSNGYHRFSRIGFTPDRRFALVGVERKNGSSDESRTVILRKIKGVWTIHVAYGGFSVS